MLFEEESTEISTGTDTLFVDVLLPFPLPKLYTYRVPRDANELVQEGIRVIVQFGKKKIYTGVIHKVHQKPPENYEAKLLLDILDSFPIITPQQFKLFDWMAEYYLCHLGEVFNAALPSGLKLSSESRIQLNPHFDTETPLNELEEIVYNNLETKGTLTYNDISSLINRKGVNKLIKALLDKEAILLFEKVKDRYSPKTEKRIRLNPEYLGEKSIEQLFAELENKAKQFEVLIKYLQKADVINSPELNEDGMLKAELVSTCSPSSLKTLVTKQYFQEFETVISRLEHFEHPDYAQELSPEQNRALEEIISNVEQKDITLFHGVTGSGKTEIYIDLIQKVIENGEQVLLLLPEIALTTQIVSRLRIAFGNDMAVYHSRYSENERVEVYQGILQNKYNLVVGVRSSIFLPFNSLGLIIIDEEHDQSYKQYDPAPRYNARDTALMLARIHSSKVLLGSATPSVESYYHATSKRWGFVELKERYGNATLPQIDPVSLKYDHHEGSHFTTTLLREIGNRLERKEQILLFQNRRGFSPYIECDDCQHTIMCDYCNVSLTYHMHQNELKCHYCGHNQGVPTNCEACGSHKLETKGFGTERIEESLSIHFPDAVIERMDLDTTRKKNSYQTLINNFSSGKVDILVGTQMITKGLDFKNVTLVGVFEIDRMLYFPDFRASEKTFQMLTQVSGRSGRNETQGQVIVQTNHPDSWVIETVVNNDQDYFYTKEINEREEFLYPPFSRLIKISIKHEDRLLSNASALYLSNLLNKKLENQLIGPEEPSINKIRNLFITDILIKIERGSINISDVKNYIAECIDYTKKQKAHKKSLYIVDVDPL